MDASQTQQPSTQAGSPPAKAAAAGTSPHGFTAQQQYADAPDNQSHPATGTWLKLDARDPEAEAAEKAYLQESARVRRGVWIGNFVAGFVVAAVVTALGYVFLPRLTRPSAAAAAAAVVGSDDQRRDAAALVQELNGKATMWKLQHYDRAPEFGRFPDWEQFTKLTSTSGSLFISAKPGTQMCGPYLVSKPVNPINNRSNVYVTDVDLAPGEPVPGPVGFVFNPGRCTFQVTDVSGMRVLDPTAKPVLPAEEKPSPAAAAAAARELEKERDAQDAKFSATMKMLRAQLELYKVQHNDSLPDFNQFPNWEQLTRKTDAAGTVVADGKFGPYVDKPVKNPLTGTARVQVVAKAPGKNFKAMSDTVAYVLDAGSGRIWPVDKDGRLMSK
jgi:hypothetical protein